MKRKIAAVMATAALLVGASTVPALADAGGGPGSNVGCATSGAGLVD